MCPITVEECGDWDPSIGRYHAFLGSCSGDEAMNTYLIRKGARRTPPGLLVLGVSALIGLGASLGGCSSGSSGGTGGSGSSSTSSSSTIVPSGSSASSGATGSSPTTSPVAAATSASVAGDWLAKQFNSAGDLPVSEGAAGLNNLPLALVALAASGSAHTAQERAGLSYLESHFESFVSLASKSKTVDAPGRLAEVILAAVATGADPAHFGGTSPKNDLVARLLVTEIGSGPDRGLFGSPNAPTYSSAFTQGLALLALTAAGQSDAVAAGWLVKQQCSDGGWMSYRSSVTKPCPAANPKTYTGPDTNSTAVAVEALAAMKVSTTHPVTSFFSDSEYPNGGFSYYGIVSKSQSVDPDSTALMLQAITDYGGRARPAIAALTSHTAQALSSFQLVCGATAAERGAFTYPGTKGPSLLATIQAIPAAAGLAFPIRPGEKGTPIPLAACGAGFREGAPSAALAHSAATATLMAFRGAAPHCASAPKVATGQVVVPVVIDDGSSGGAAVKVTCVSVPAGSSGAVALAAAADATGEPAPVYASSGLLCSIGGYPAAGCGAATGTRYAYWAYFHGGTRWKYAENGPAATVVQRGDVEGWRFQPHGTATSADPPPRAASSVQALELGATVGGTAAGGAGGSPSGSGGTDTLQIVLVVLGALLAAGGLSFAFVRTRRTGAMSS